MSSCQRFAPMIGSRPGELSPAEAQGLADHLRGCPACRAFAADAEVTSHLLADALLRRAAARDFAPFVDEVLARTGSGRARRRWRAVLAVGVPALAAALLFMYVRPDRAWFDRLTVNGEPEQQLASLEISTEGAIGAVLPTADGPVILLQPDDESGS